MFVSQDGYVTSDCDADADVFNTHHYTSTAEEAVADVLKVCTLAEVRACQDYSMPFLFFFSAAGWDGRGLWQLCAQQRCVCPEPGPHF